MENLQSKCQCEPLLFAAWQSPAQFGDCFAFGLQRRKHKLYIILPALFKNKKQDFLNNTTYKLGIPPSL